MICLSNIKWPFHSQSLLNLDKKKVHYFVNISTKTVLFQDSSDSLMIMIFFVMLYICNSNSSTYFQKNKGLHFDIFSTTQLRAPKRRKHISKGLLKGTKSPFGWRWKNRRIENSKRMEKWKDRKYFIFFPFCLVGSGKVEG